jgi:hypothetical protein
VTQPPPDPGPSCGELGGDYCSQSGACPAGRSSLGQTHDCNPCCASEPPPDPGLSCEGLGGNYCSHTGACPAGHDTLGQTPDCNPCCRTQPPPAAGNVALEVQTSGLTSAHAASSGDGGDLFLTVACYAIVEYVYPSGPPAYVLTLSLNIEGEVKTEQFHGLGGGEHRIEMTVPAKAYDRLVECSAGTSFGAGGYATGILKNSGPAVVRITVGAFIPHEWIMGPSIFADRVYEGDDRGFREDAGSSRIAAVIDVVNPAYSVSPSEHHPYAGFSQEYEGSSSLSEPPSHLTPAARNDWMWGPPHKTKWGSTSTDNVWCAPRSLGPDPEHGVTRLRVLCKGAANNPLVISPDIDYEFDFELTFGQGKIAYKLTGCHDGYPAYEAYIGGAPVYTQPPISATPWGVFGFCTYPILEAGEFP